SGKRYWSACCVRCWTGCCLSRWSAYWYAKSASGGRSQPCCGVSRSRHDDEREGFHRRPMATAQGGGEGRQPATASVMPLSRQLRFALILHTSLIGNLQHISWHEGTMQTGAVKEAIRGITTPIRHNNLGKRRQELGLSRVALGRILGVDPATVYRQERKRP